MDPIESGWKDLKRKLSGIPEFDRAVQEVKPAALELFNQRRLSYTSYWAQKFINDKG